MIQFHNQINMTKYHNFNPEIFHRGIDCTPGKCWIWPWSKSKDGHGRINTGKRRTTAHRHAFELHHNVTLASDLVVRHSCDNPACINPEHLLLGHHVDNVRDMDARGRRFMIISFEQRKEITDLYKSGQYTQQQLGFKFKIDQSQISRIINNKTNH